MKWYKFEKGNPVGIPRIRSYRVCYFENEKCTDELVFTPNEAAKVMPYTLEKEFEVYAVFSKNEVYRINLERVEN